MPRATKPELSGPNWSRYQHRPAARISHCCLLLMGLQPSAAREARVMEWPARSALGKQYNALLVEAYHAIAGKNPLLQPLVGELTVDRAEFQKLMVPLAYFVAFASSDMSPFAAVLKQPVPDAFKSLSPPTPPGYRRAEDLLSELRSTYRNSNSHEDQEQVDAPAAVTDGLARGDKQLALYTGVLLRWVYETQAKQNWLWGSSLNAKAIEADLLAWLCSRAERSSDAPKPGTMRRHFGIAARAFDHTYKLKAS